MIKTNPAGGNGGAGLGPKAAVDCLRVFHCTPGDRSGQSLCGLAPAARRCWRR